jgi:hypothetical protein
LVTPNAGAKHELLLKQTSLSSLSMNESNNLQVVKLKSPSELKHPDSRNLLVYSFAD